MAEDEERPHALVDLRSVAAGQVEPFRRVSPPRGKAALRSPEQREGPLTLPAPRGEGIRSEPWLAFHP
jgi:hypothetical protein